VSLLALLAAAFAGAALAAPLRTQTIVLAMGPDESGAMSIGASTFGDVIALDPSKLRLLARPFAPGTSGGSQLGIVASIGAAQESVPSGPRGYFLTHPLPYSVQHFSIPVELSGPPGPPGIYDVWPDAAAGFATARDGTPIPLADRSGFSAAYPEQISWPDESGNDRVLEALRKKLVGRSVYGYGGIAISCRPQSTTFYAASTPVRIRSIERERGKVMWLGTGSAASAPLVIGLGFIAYDPVSINVDQPDPTRYPPLGSNGGVGGATKMCPAFELADWQIDTTLSLRPPPSGIATPQTPLRIGMSRDDLVWARGYPNEVGTRAVLRAESIWHYGAAMSQFTVTLVEGRIASFTTPSNM